MFDFQRPCLPHIDYVAQYVVAHKALTMKTGVRLGCRDDFVNSQASRFLTTKQAISIIW